MIESRGGLKSGPTRAHRSFPEYTLCTVQLYRLPATRNPLIWLAKQGGLSLKIKIGDAPVEYRPGGKRIILVSPSQCPVCKPPSGCLAQKDRVPCPNPPRGNLANHKIQTMREIYELVKANVGKSLFTISMLARNEDETMLRHIVTDLQYYGIVHVDHHDDGRRRPLHVAEFDLDTVRWIMVEKTKYMPRLEMDPLGHNRLEMED